MNFGGLSEYAGQGLIIQAALEALSVVMAVLFSLTLAAFAVYLTGVWLLCRAEDCLNGGSALSRKGEYHE